MKKHSLLAIALMAFCFVMYACASSDDETKPTTPPPTTTTPEETNVKPTGGSLKSDDNNVSVSIPAGAVDKAVNIKVEAISSDLAKGVGKIYRLTHQEFAKPVTLAINYNTEELTTKGTYPELLRLMTRESASDTWEVVKNFTIDKTNKVLTANVTHFSDWTIVSTEGTLSFTADGVTHSDLNLSVIMGSKNGKFIQLYASNNESFFRAKADSTVMGTSYETRSFYLGKISGLTNSIADTTNVLFLEPAIKYECYTHFDGSSRLGFKSFPSTPGSLVTGSFKVVGVVPPVDNVNCQPKKSITGNFAYIVK